MTKATPIQTNFTAGEITPRLYGNVDFARYKNALKLARNAMILPHGPVIRRSGFDIIEPTKDSSKQSRLLRFQFDQSNAYILEVGDLYIRFFVDGGSIEVASVPYEVVTTYTQSEIWGIRFVQFGRILYLYHGNHPPAQLVWTSDASWALSDVAFYPPATDEAGWNPATTITPAATTGSGVNFTAGAGTVFLAADVGRQIQNLVGTGKAVITSVSSATVAVCTIVENFPSTAAIVSGNWKIDLSPITAVTPSGSKLGSVITLTGAAACWINTPAVNNYVLINNGVVKILSLTSTTVANGEVQKTLTAVTADEGWSLERPAWSASFGYPSTCAFHQQRLFTAATNLAPISIWGTEIGLITSMGVGATDSDAVAFDISGKDISKISWLANLRTDLVVGTPSGEFTIDGGQSSSITPTSTIQQVRGYTGSNPQQPLGLDDQLIYIQKSGVKLMALRYDYQIDNYISEDLLFLAEHIAKDGGGIKEIAYANDPDKNIFAVLNDGSMAVCTYVRDQQVNAWSLWKTAGSFESVQTISTGINDEIWVIVKRSINGQSVRYIERYNRTEVSNAIASFSDSCLSYDLPKTITSVTEASPGVVTATAHGFSNGDLVKIIDAVDADGLIWGGVGITYKVANKTTDTFELNTISGNPVDTDVFETFLSGNVHKLVTTISGLGHLEGETVQVKADGAAHSDKIVSGGSITLDQNTYKATVGLKYTTNITTLPREFNLEEGSSQGQRVRHVRPVLRVFESARPMLNNSFLPSRSPQDRMDKAIPLYTGDLVYGDLTWKDNYSSSLVIETSAPLPLMILGIFGSVEGHSQ